MENFEQLLQKQLDKLPYVKHQDDGLYNDGQVDGFELGARWANQLEPTLNFWERLKSFVQNVQVNDPMSDEEKDMIIHVCNEKLKP